MNKVILIGRLTRDPELTTIGGGTEVCKFGLAVDRQFKSQSGEKLTDFFNIVVWRAQGVNCHKFLKKGSQCAVFGRIEIRSYEKDGEKRTATDIVADQVEFLGKPSGGGGGDDFGDFNQDFPQPQKKGIDTLEPIDDENLPF